MKSIIKNIKWPSFKQAILNASIIFLIVAVLSSTLFGWTDLIKIAVSKFF